MRAAHIQTGPLVVRALLGALAPMAACTHAASRPSSIPGASPAVTSSQADTAPNTTVALRVVSHNSSDVVIYVGRERMRQRLGTVTGSTTRTLVIPGRFAADGNGFYLFAHRVGGGLGTDLTSPSVNVQPGQTVVWTLESDLPSSSLSVE